MQHFVRGRTLWIALIAVLLALPARAEQADVFTVTGVKVEAKGARPDLARAKAVSDGERVALARLLRKITLAEDHARLPKPDAETVRNAVRNFSVESENQQGDRYTASIAYRFDRDAVRAMLEGAGLQFLETPSPPLVVLPVWKDEGKPTLWDDPNPWREAWMRLEPADTMVDFARLRGDLADLKAISGEEAAAGNRAALGRIADHYKAGLIAVADRLMPQSVRDAIDCPCIVARRGLEVRREQGEGFAGIGSAQDRAPLGGLEQRNERIAQGLGGRRRVVGVAIVRFLLQGRIEE